MRSGIRRTPVSVRFFAVLLFVVLAAFTRDLPAQAPAGGFEPLTAQRGRGYFAQMSFESIDMVSGNLGLSFGDLSLPGNAGMSVGIQRSMNYGADQQWTVGLAGVPVAIEGIVAPPSGPWTVGTVGSDGSRHAVPYQSGVDTYVLDSLARVTLSTRTVELPNGWVATYETTSGVTQAELQEVHDSYGNAIDATWLARPSGSTGATHVSALSLHDVGDPTRTVSFTYDATGSDVLTVTSEGHTWMYAYDSTHRMTSAQAPVGDPWLFAYGTDTMTVTTPNGGTVTYTFVNETDGMGHIHPMIATRAIGGRGITAATWTFGFNRSVDPVVSTVDAPDGRRLEYQHHAVTDPTGGAYWTLVKQTLLRGSAEISRLQRTFTTCGDSFLPMVQTDTAVEHGQTFTTTYTYHASYVANCDAHRPYQVVQSGDLARTSTSVFTYPTSQYRLDLVSSTSTTVGTDSVTTNLTYDALGFLTSRSTAGVQTWFAPDFAGNLASLTDANAHVTTFTYAYGTNVSTHTPLFTISRTVNTDGSVATETRRGLTTTYSYDTGGRLSSVASPGHDTVSYTYAASSTVATQAGSSVTTGLDGFGRSTGWSDPMGISTSIEYNADGQVTRQVLPSQGATTASEAYTYSDLGQADSVAHSGGGTSTTVDSGSTVVTTDENGHATTAHYQLFAPGDGRLASVTDPSGQTWSYGYNGFGSLTSVTEPGGLTRTLTYDARNHLVSETSPESGTATYTYDDVGNPLTKTDANGVTVHSVYDANNRLVLLCQIVKSRCLSVVI